MACAEPNAQLKHSLSRYCRTAILHCKQCVYEPLAGAAPLFLRHPYPLTPLHSPAPLTTRQQAPRPLRGCGPAYKRSPGPSHAAPLPPYVPPLVLFAASPRCWCHVSVQRARLRPRDLPFARRPLQRITLHQPSLRAPALLVLATSPASPSRPALLARKSPSGIGYISAKSPSLDAPDAKRPRGVRFSPASPAPAAARSDVFPSSPGAPPAPRSPRTNLVRVRVRIRG